jgi:hypothetical protein
LFSHVDDGAEDLGLALGRSAWAGGPTVLGNQKREVPEAGSGQVVPPMPVDEAVD